MPNDELCNAESTSYNVHVLWMSNDKLFTVELLAYNIHEHMLELNSHICVGEFGVNIGSIYRDNIPLRDAKNSKTLKRMNICKYTLGNMSVSVISHSWIVAGAEHDAHQFYVTCLFKGVIGWE
jgi:hypothetical protein